MKPLFILVVAFAWMSVARAAQLYTDVTTAMGISVADLGSGTAWADFDNDGDQDLLVSNSGFPSRVYLYRNDGTVFTNVFTGSGLAAEARNFAVGDYDNDGLEDVAFISFGYVETKLFRNLGGMHFQDVSAAAGIHGTYAWRCAWIDYDNNGYLDFYQTGSTSFLFQNLGNGTFQDVAAAAGVNDSYDTSGVCAGDFDGDGWFDLYSVNIGSPSNRLYHNLGNGTFQDITASAGVGDVGDGRTATFLDIDYDGLVDLFSSNHVYANRLYRNNGNMTFTNIASTIGIANPMDPFGVGFADYDNDGDLDVFLATHFGNKLLRCDGVTNHWLQIRPVGTTSNRSGIGAVVRCVAGGHTEYFRVDGGHGMGDTDSPALEFGLGATAGPIDVRVRWPSGLVETWTNLMADTRVTLREGASADVAEETGSTGGLHVLGIAPNPAVDACVVRFRAPLGPEERVHIAVLNPAGRMVRGEDAYVGSRVTTWFLPVRGLVPGTYFVRLTAGRETAGAKIIVLK